MEKVQHEPQDPWFLTSETAPLSRQSIASGVFLFRASSVGSVVVPVAEQFCPSPRPRLGVVYAARNASGVRSETNRVRGRRGRGRRGVRGGGG